MVPPCREYSSVTISSDSYHGFLLGSALWVSCRNALLDHSRTVPVSLEISEQITETSSQWRSDVLKHWFLCTWNNRVRTSWKSREFQARKTAPYKRQPFLGCSDHYFPESQNHGFIAYVLCHVTATIPLPWRIAAVRVCKLVEPLKWPITACLLQYPFQLCVLLWYLRIRPENHSVPE